MSVSGIKPSRSAAPQLEGRPSYERDFGIGSHEEYAKPQVVQREFQRVNERVDQVKRDLKTASETLDEKITGLEARLTTKIDTQKAHIDDKFEQQEKKFQERMSQLQLNLDSALDTHYESVGRRFNGVDADIKDMDKRVDERFTKIDERFTKIDDRLDTIEEDIGDMKEDMKQIKQMLQHLLTQGGVPPTPLPSSSSQAPYVANTPPVVVHAPPTPVAGPSSPRRRPRSSATPRDAASIDSHGSQRDQIASVLRSIQRKVSRGFGLLNKSKERLDQ